MRARSQRQGGDAEPCEALAGPRIRDASFHTAVQPKARAPAARHAGENRVNAWLAQIDLVGERRSVRTAAHPRSGRGRSGAPVRDRRPRGAGDVETLAFPRQRGAGHVGEAVLDLHELHHRHRLHPERQRLGGRPALGRAHVRKGLTDEIKAQERSARRNGGGHRVIAPREDEVADELRLGRRGPGFRPGEQENGLGRIGGR